MTGVYAAAERLMGMNDRVWARHANPWSCYSRFTALPLLALAIWSRDWIGAGAWVAVAVALVWIWVNPRAFPPPVSLDNWASRGVLGERVFLKRRAELRGHHRAWAAGLAWAALPGVVVLALGLWWLEPWWTLFGMVLAMGPKVWFVDRMVWAYADWLSDNDKELGDV